MDNKLEKSMDKAYNFIKNRNTINGLFLIIAIVCVLLLNSLMPLISGGSHYTESPVDMTYQEYTELKEQDNNYNLTYKSNKQITKFINKEKELPEGLILNDYIVTVYTQFFFEAPIWYTSIAVQVVCILLIYYSTFNFFLGHKKETHELYIKKKNEVETAVQNELDPITFEPWVLYEFNFNRKETQYICNIRKKLDKLEQRTKYKVKHLPLTHYKRIKYEKKKEQIKSLLNKEHIKTYILSKNVKGFKYIYPSFIQTGYNMKHTYSVDNYSLYNSDTSRISKDAVWKVLLSILLPTLLALVITFSIITSLEDPWYVVLLNILTKIVPLVMQVPSAFNYTERFMETQLITNMQLRLNIALLYMAERNKAGFKEHIDSLIKDYEGSLNEIPLLEYKEGEQNA